MFLVTAHARKRVAMFLSPHGGMFIKDRKGGTIMNPPCARQVHCPNGNLLRAAS